MEPSGAPASTSRSPLRVRQLWFDDIVSRLQTTEGGALLLDAEDAHLTLKRLGHGLPDPRTHLERLLLRGLLLEVACRCGHRLHLQCCDSRGPCDLPEGALLERFFGDPSPDPKRPFLRWLREFFGELGRVHPQSPSRRLARHLRRAYGQRVELHVWASSLGMSTAQVRRAFKREFGQSVSDYQRCARIVAALDLGTEINVARVARRVGYRSKKNFYRAFARLTGTTPAAFNRLPERRRHEIVEHTRLTLTPQRALPLRLL